MTEQEIEFKESISQETPKLILAKSPNKCNWLVMSAETLSEDLIDVIERKIIGPNTKGKELKAILKDLGWSENDYNNILGFGPGDDGPSERTLSTRF